MHAHLNAWMPEHTLNTYVIKLRLLQDSSRATLYDNQFSAPKTQLY